MDNNLDLNSYYEELINDAKKYLAEAYLETTKKEYTTWDDSIELMIKYHADIDKLEYIDGKSDWIDLRSAEEVELKAGEFKLINLGVSIKLPYGYEANIVPRSSTFKNWGIIQTNSFAVIDETYCGDNDIWRYPVYATRDTVIHKNDRICQFRINEHQPRIKFTETDHLNGENRGGFGSTGV